MDGVGIKIRFSADAVEGSLDELKATIARRASGLPDAPRTPGERAVLRKAPEGYYAERAFSPAVEKPSPDPDDLKILTGAFGARFKKPRRCQTTR